MHWVLFDPILLTNHRSAVFLAPPFKSQVSAGNLNRRGREKQECLFFIPSTTFANGNAKLTAPMCNELNWTEPGPFGGETRLTSPRRTGNTNSLFFLGVSCVFGRPRWP